MALAIACALLATWTGAAPWARAIGNPLGEADNHRWMWWRAVRRLAGEAGPWANLPVGVPVPVMDPANLLFYLPGALAGPVVGWNLAAVSLVLLSGLGAWALASELSVGDGLGVDGPMLALAAGITCPFLAGVLDFGISESWGCGWFSLHAALLLRYGRTGRLRDAVGAGACLAAIAMSGWYQALFGLVLEPPLVAWVLVRGGRRRWPGLVVQGAMALVIRLPGYLDLLERGALWAGRFQPLPTRPPPPRPDWRSLPVLGTDLLNLFLPRLDADAPSKAVYLGLTVVLLALVGAALRPRRVIPLLLVAGLPLGLALGPWPSVAGRALGWMGPAGWLVRWTPELGAVSHWYRAVGPASGLLAAAAGLGAAAIVEAAGLRASSRALGMGLLTGLVVVDGLGLGPTRWPRRAIADDTPALLIALAAEAEAVADEGPRGVIQLPFDNGRTMFSAEPARTYDRWQIRHGLPRSENYEGVDVVLQTSDLVAAWQAATGLVSTLPPEQRARRRPGPLHLDPAAISAELRRLREQGYRWVVLHRRRAPDPERAQAAVESVLGRGRRVGDSVAWALGGPGGG